MMKRFILLLSMSAVALAMQPTLRVMTLNTALLKLAHGVGSVQPGVRVRAGNIMRAIRAIPEDQRPDVIALQEGFAYTLVEDAIWKPLKDLYPYAYIDKSLPAAFTFGVNSGLSILSKYPIKQRALQPYTCFTGDGYAAKKGVLAVKLDVNGCDVYVFTTHMQAGASDSPLYKGLALTRTRTCEGLDGSKLDTNQIRYLELRQAKKFIESFMDNQQAPALFMGDFNIEDVEPGRDNDTVKDPHNPEVSFKEATMIKRVFPDALDSWDSARSPEKSTVFKADRPYQRIDYILNLYPEFATISSVVYPGFTAAVEHPDGSVTGESDHRPVLGSVTITQCGPKIDKQTEISAIKKGEQAVQRAAEEVVAQIQRAGLGLPEFEAEKISDAALAKLKAARDEFAQLQEKARNEGVVAATKDAAGQAASALQKAGSTVSGWLRKKVR